MGTTKNTTMEPYNVQYYIAKYGTVENLTKDYEGAIGYLRMQYKQYEDNPHKGGRYRREKMKRIKEQAEAIFDELLRVSRAMKEYLTAQATEMPQVSTETAETVNVSAEGENAAERTSIEQNHSDTRIVEDEYRHKYKVTRHWLNGRVESIEVWDLDLAAEPPQSPETPQAVECTTDSDCRVCSHCGKHFHEGYFLGDEYACSEECAVALYGGDRELFEADLEAEEEEAGATECYWTTW